MHNWRIKIALFLIYVVFAMLLNSVGTVILQVMGNYDLRHVDAAILEAFKDLPIAVVSLLVASFLPRLGFRRAMMLGLAIVTGACIAMPLVPAFLTTKLLFLCVGASFALVKVSVYATVGLITEDAKEHASTMNTLEGMFMIGVLMGYWIFAQFVSIDDPKSQDWLNVYWLLAGIAAFTFVVLFFTPYDESGSKLENSSRSLGDDFVGMLRLVIRPVAYVFVISAFLYVLIEQGIGTWLPTFNKEILHLPTDMAIEAGIIFSGTLAIGRLSAGAVLARFDWYPVLNFCLVAMAVLVLLVLPLTHGAVADANITWLTAPPAAYIFPLIGLFMAPIYPAINSVVLSALPRHQHAAMTGLIVIFSALGGTTGSLITGRVFGAFGGQTAFYFSLVPMVGILIALYFFRRETRRTGEAVTGEA